MEEISLLSTVVNQPVGLSFGSQNDHNKVSLENTEGLCLSL